MLSRTPSLNDRLIAFWQRPAPEVTRLLPADNPLPPERTALDFLLQLFWETQRIIDYGPMFLGPVSLVKRLSATESGGPLLHAHDRTAKALEKGFFDDAALASLRALPRCIGQIVAYHKVVYAKNKDKSLTTELAIQKAQQRLHRAIETRDGETLLAFYPYEAPILYDDGETDVPAAQGNVYPIVRRRMARAIEGEAAKNGLILLRQATPIEELDNRLNEAQALTNRSGPLYESLTTFLQDLQRVLDPAAAPKRYPVLAFRSESFIDQPYRPRLKPRQDKVRPLRSPPPSSQPAP